MTKESSRRSISCVCRAFPVLSLVKILRCLIQHEPSIDDLIRAVFSLVIRLAGNKVKANRPLSRRDNAFVCRGVLLALQLAEFCTTCGHKEICSRGPWRTFNSDDLRKIRVEQRPTWRSLSTSCVNRQRVCGPPK